MDKKKPISNIMYDFSEEVAYWDNYICRLIDFIRYESLTDDEVFELQAEISRVEFHKKQLCTDMSEYLKLTDKIK